ncbi:MAG: hypothetical protein A2156_05040 [Deltaproteobacteria bacterium RBG_16_48_10]|nr:MAG: hypothetical protein A2156_05040 [Deltaproteobacteria bacterium RBG_16_48_10]
MYSLLVGVDVSKDFFSASGLGAEGKECFSGTYEMNSHGFSEFLKTLSSHGEGLDQTILAMESTRVEDLKILQSIKGVGPNTA